VFCTRLVYVILVTYAKVDVNIAPITKRDRNGKLTSLCEMMNGIGRTNKSVKRLNEVTNICSSPIRTRLTQRAPPNVVKAHVLPVLGGHMKSMMNHGITAAAVTIPSNA
jgi:hypothetical protein